MDEQAPDIFAQLRGLWDKLTPGKRLAFVLALAASVIGVGYVSCAAETKNYETLYSGLTMEDAGDVVNHLQAAAIPYKVSSGGTAVSVPADRVHEIRIQMASQGLPRGGGIGFEVFDDQGFGTTTFVEQVNFRRALQGELARTIASIDGVTSARVHIALGERSVFRDADNPPSASVALRLRGGRRLTSDQVRGVVYMVASSVDGLPPERVVIVDEDGNVLSSGEDGAGTEAQHELEQTLEARAQSMLEKFVGVGHASVVVTAQMDNERFERTEEVYDKENPVVRSEKITSERVGGSGTVGGIAGARGNLPGTGSPGTGSGANGVNRISETRNFEVNRTVTHTTNPTSTVKRLHVAVLVDYVPDETAAAAAAAAAGGNDSTKKSKKKKKGEEEEKEVTAMRPRTQEELDRIAGIVREATGLDPERGDRIEVHSVAFTPIPVEGEEVTAPAAPFPVPLTFMIAAGLGVLALIVLALIVMSSRGKLAQRPQVLTLPARVSQVERELEPRSHAALGDGSDPNALGQAPVYQRVARATRSDAQRAARVVQGWLHEGPKPKGAR